MCWEKPALLPTPQPLNCATHGLAPLPTHTQTDLPVQCGTLLDATYFAGTPLGNCPVRCVLAPTADVPACCQLCSSNPLCTAFMFHSTTNECWLMDASRIEFVQHDVPYYSAIMAAAAAGGARPNGGQQWLPTCATGRGWWGGGPLAHCKLAASV